MSNLKILDISENELGSIPPTISTLGQLKEFNLTRTNLSELPLEIGLLVNLEKLDVSQNYLEAIPDSCQNLQKLVVFVFNFNDFIQIPDCLKGIPTLKSIGCGGNRGIFSEKDFSDFPQIKQVSNECFEPNEIISKLFLGSYLTGLNKNFLLQNKVTHILILEKSILPVYPKLFIYHVVHIDDLEVETISNHFDQMAKFISEGIAGGGILVHCAAGISRSPTAVIAYLMKFKRVSFAESYEMVRQKRQEIRPNEGFITQLQAYEKELKIGEKEVCNIS